MTATVTWLGTATLLIEVGGLRILTDPALGPVGESHALGPGIRYTRTAAAAVPAGGLGGLDLVLVSHDHHLDNFDPAGLEVARQAKTVITTVAGARRLAARGFTQVRGLAPWEKIEVAGLTITATPARHGPPLTDFITGPVIGFGLESKRLAGPLWLTGDTRWFPPLERVLEQLRPTSIAVHAGGASFVKLLFSMTSAEVIDLARRAPQARLTPIHLGSWSHFSEGKAQLRPALSAAGLDARIDWLTPGVARQLPW